MARSIDFADPALRVARNPALATGEIDGELVALDLAGGSCFGLDPVGTRIWHLAAQPVSLAELVDALVGEYEVTAEDCARDVGRFVAEMVEAGMLISAP